MKLSTFDVSQPGIITQKFNPVEPTESNMDEMFIESEALFKSLSGVKSILILDLREAKYLSSELRIKQGNWLKKTESLMKEKLETVIMVNTSVMMNLVLKGIFLIKKPAVSTEIVTNIEQALKIAEEKLMSGAGKKAG